MLYKYQTNCTLGCTENEDQEHMFMNCEKIKTKHNISYKYLFETKENQKQAIRVFLNIDSERQQAIEALPPWGGHCQDPCCSQQQLVLYLAEVE